jgi:uncharacterized membrane protein
MSKPQNSLPPQAVVHHPFRRAVLRGLAVLAPPLLTILIIVWAINTTKSYFLEPVTHWAREAIVWYLADIREGVLLKDPATKTIKMDGEEYRRLDDGELIPQFVFDYVQKEPGASPPVTAKGFYRCYVDLRYLKPYYAIPFFLSLFILLLYFLGKFMAVGIGRVVGHTIETLIARLPGVRAVYASVKQVSDFVLTERAFAFTRIVAVEYPRKGVWQMGFVTSEGLAAVRDAVGEPLVTVLLPYSPLPITGCTITVRKSECIDLNITFDQACQFIVSCGVVVPPAQVVAAGAD